MRATDLRRSRIRLRTAEVLLLAAFLGLTVRAAHLSLIDVRGAERGAMQVFSRLHLPPQRGLIVDRHADLLAVTADAPSVYAVPHVVEDPGAVAAALAPVLGARPERLRRQLSSRLPFVFLARWVEPAQAERIERLDLPGVGVVPEPRRSYPHTVLAGPLLGFANIDGEGVRGIERMEDPWLRGSRRRVRVERDARGRLLVGPGLDPRESAGGDVAVSLDLAFQADAEAALERAVRRTGARGGFVISLDPHTGEVLALAERPGFDPNRFRSVAYTETRSRVFLDALEPGSTLKLFLVAAALEAGAVKPHDVIDLEGGAIRVPGKRIRDLHPREALDVGGVLRVSSNVGAVKIAQQLGPQVHFEMLRRFGLARSTGSGFPEESAGLLRDWHDWKPVDHATIAFGQGINVTPMQLAAATAVIASGGNWRPPHLVIARRRPGEPWSPVSPDARAARRVVSRETAAAVLEMMEGVVGPEGTGGRAGLLGVRVAGKTGTAQKLDAESGGYADDRYVAWFAGVVPADAPRLVIVTGLDEPRGPAHTGGSAAAPLFAQVAAAHLTRLGAPTEPRPIRPAPRTEVRTARRTPATESKPRVDPPAASPARARPSQPPARTTPKAAPVARLGPRVLLPDFRGLSVDEVRRITADTSLVVELSGVGRAISQEPAPGTIVRGDGGRVRVRFAPAEREG